MSATAERDLGYSRTEMMIAASARGLEGAKNCFVGVGLPNIVCNLAQRTVARDLQLVYESGVFGARPERLPLSIGDPTLATGEMTLVTLHPGMTLDDVRANMGWEPKVSPELGETPEPTPLELGLIREELDPTGAYTR